MTIIINGKKEDINNSLNLEEVVQFFTQPNQALIVELNGKIIKQKNRKYCQLNPGDRLELIQLVGGG